MAAQNIKIKIEDEDDDYEVKANIPKIEAASKVKANRNKRKKLTDPIIKTEDEDEVKAKMPKNENDFKVEAIRDKRIGDKGILQYGIKWKSYPERENTWEPVENCLDAFQMIIDWEDTKAGDDWEEQQKEDSDDARLIPRDDPENASIQQAYENDQDILQSGCYDIVEALGKTKEDKFWFRMQLRPGYTEKWGYILKDERVLSLDDRESYLKDAINNDEKAIIDAYEEKCFYERFNND